MALHDKDRHSRKVSRATMDDDHPKSFDVTCTIGTVEFGLARAQRLSPVEAAFVLIAKHDADGTFHFTVPGGEVDGWEYEVSVQRKIATGAGS